MKKDSYEDLVTELIKSAVILDHTVDPCSDNFIPHDKVNYSVEL